jgi:DNA-binding MarR family transcriptional regulator
MAAMAVDELTSERLGMLLARHGRFVAERILHAMSATGLKPRHRQVLVELSTRGPTSQQSLIDALDVDPSVLVAILNDLERLGLAERRRDPADRRRHIVEMSAKGCKALEGIEKAVALAEDELFADLDERERAQLHDMLTRVRTVPESEACVETKNC